VLAQEPSSGQAVGDQQRKARQHQDTLKFDTSSLEKAIRESVREASEKPDGHGDEKLQIDRQIKEYTGQLATYTDRLSFYTFLLAVATAILGAIGIWQGIQLKRSVDLGREEFIASHPPVLETRRFQFRQEPNDVCGVEFVIGNTGLTRAEISLDHVHLRIVTPLQLVEIKALSFPQYQEGGANALTKRRYEPNERQAQFIAIGDVTLETLGQIMTGERVLIAFGRIQYRDPGGVERERLFWREFNSDLNRFERYNDLDYDNNPV